MQRDAEQAFAWAESGSDPSNVPAAWEKKLPGGTMVRLLAVSNIVAWSGCWWNGDGEAIQFSTSPIWERVAEPSSRQVTVELDDPHFLEGSSRYAKGAGMRFQSFNTVKVGAALRVTAGSGTWNKGPVVKPGDSVSVGGAQVTVIQVGPGLLAVPGNAGSSQVTVSVAGDTGVDVVVVAVDREGKEYGPDSPWVEFGDAGNFGRGRDSVSRRWIGVEKHLDATDHLELRWRKRETAVFEGFATEPKISPDEVRRKKEALGVVAVKSKSGVSAPGNFLDMFRAAVKSHDAKKVRSVIVARGAEAEKYAAEMVETIVSTQMLVDAAEQRFGPDTLEAFGASPLQSWEQRLWKVEGNRAAMVVDDGTRVWRGPIVGLVNVNGDWRIEVKLEDMTDEQRTEMWERMDAQKRQPAIYREIAQEIAAESTKMYLTHATNLCGG